MLILCLMWKILWQNRKKTLYKDESYFVNKNELSRVSIYIEMRLLATHLSSIGHFHAVQRTSSRSGHFTHKAGLQWTER